MMSDFTDVLKALASVAWPAFAFTVLFVLKPEIKDFISRIRKGKVLGAEIDLDQKLDQLKDSVDLAKSEIPNEVAAPTAEVVQAGFADRILNEAGVSPLAAFMRLSSELERVANSLMNDFDPAAKQRKLTLQEAFKRMPVDIISPEIRRSLQMFSSIRNRIVHENYSVTNSEILRAIDIGLNLLFVLEVVTVDMMALKEKDEV
jgi:hypothetical protein